MASFIKSSVVLFCPKHFPHPLPHKCLFGVCKKSACILQIIIIFSFAFLYTTFE